MTNRNRSHRSWPWRAAALAAAALVLAGCASKAGSDNASSSSGSAAGGPLVIGASVSLTGDFSDSRQGGPAGLPALGRHRERQGRHPRPEGPDQDRRRRVQPHAGRHELPEPDQQGPRRSRRSARSRRCSPSPPRRSPSATTTRSSPRPAAAPTSSSRTSTTSSSSSRRRPRRPATCSPSYILGLPADQRPKTAAYAELDDPFSAPIAENIRAKFEAAGIKTVYKQVYPSETQDLSPVMAAVAAKQARRRSSAAPRTRTRTRRSRAWSS